MTADTYRVPMINDDQTKDQARQLYQTVRMLKDRVGHTFSCRHRGETKPCAEMTFAQCNVLMVLQERGESSLKELADALHVSHPSASAMVDKLVEIGMLSREQSDVDRREVRIRLSDSGLEHFQDLEEEILRYLTELLNKLGPDYAAQWCEVYAKIREVVKGEMAAETASVVPEDSMV